MTTRSEIGIRCCIDVLVSANVFGPVRRRPEFDTLGGFVERICRDVSIGHGSQGYRLVGSPLV